jgi:hypothetical protein
MAVAPVTDWRYCAYSTPSLPSRSLSLTAFFLSRRLNLHRTLHGHSSSQPRRLPQQQHHPNGRVQDGYLRSGSRVRPILHFPFSPRRRTPDSAFDGRGRSPRTEPARVVSCRSACGTEGEKREKTEKRRRGRRRWSHPLSSSFRPGRKVFELSRLHPPFFLSLPHPPLRFRR